MENAAADERPEKILASAAELFIKVGFRKANMDELSRGSGVSVGGIYDFFENKTCVFYAALKQIIDHAFCGSITAFPLRQADFVGLESECTAAMAEFVQTFGAPLRKRRDDYTYADMLSDAFDMLSPFGMGSLLLKANPRVCPVVFKYFNKTCVELHKLFDGYLRLFQSRGEIRPLADTDLPARFLLESIYWWGSMIHYKDFDPANAHIPRDLAKLVCTQALYRAYSNKQ
ncbi:MAG: TetR/AcrR family transcriptional regulator [Oscillospiraceae bacterium]|jgi:AcrR family transcriptional regulator|nr:TetR/AcrR family transcriptional regulator [Oscillospiraceae bacterium]